MRYFESMRSYYAFVCFILCVYVFNVSQASSIIVANEDDSNFYMKSKPEDMTVDGARRYIDYFKGSGVTYFFMCPNAQRAAFRSKTRQAIWDAPASGASFEQSLKCATAPLERTWRAWVSNAKLAHERGVDVYKVWIERCREVGISPWITMRMNDIHFPKFPDYIGHGSFWFENPQFRREKGRPFNPSLNYKHKEVRRHQFAFVEELFERYDFDGFELDWMRSGLNLSPHKGREQAHFITEFVADVRKLADKYEKIRGHKISISVRVSADPEAALYVGLDAVKWAREGYVDIIVVASRAVLDFDINFKKWKDAIGQNSKVKLLACAENRLRSGASAFVRTDIPTLDAWLVGAFYKGADGVCLFNLFPPSKYVLEFFEKGVNLQRAKNAPRRHIVTYNDYMEIPEGSEAWREMQLPRDDTRAGEFRVLFGYLPDNVNSAKISVVIGFAKSEGLDCASYKVLLNGVEALSNKDESHLKPYGGAARAVRYYFPSSAIKAGYNTIRAERVDTGNKQNFAWVELDCGI